MNADSEYSKPVLTCYGEVSGLTAMNVGNGTDGGMAGYTLT